MTTTTRPVQADLGCVRRAISGTAARTTNVTSNAKIEPSSFMAVAHPPSQTCGDRRSPLLFFRRARRLRAAMIHRALSPSPIPTDDVLYHDPLCGRSEITTRVCGQLPHHRGGLRRQG